MSDPVIDWPGVERIDCVPNIRERYARGGEELSPGATVVSLGGGRRVVSFNGGSVLIAVEPDGGLTPIPAATPK
jgi:hypothetical protein